MTRNLWPITLILLLILNWQLSKYLNLNKDFFEIVQICLRISIIFFVAERILKKEINFNGKLQWLLIFLTALVCSLLWINFNSKDALIVSIFCLLKILKKVINQVMKRNG